MVGCGLRFARRVRLAGRSRVRSRRSNLVQDLLQSIAELRNGIGEFQQVGADDGPGQMEAVAGIVDMALQGSGLFAPESK